MTYQILCEYLYRQQEMTDNGFSEMTDGMMIEGKSNLVLKDDAWLPGQRYNIIIPSIFLKELGP